MGSFEDIARRIYDLERRLKRLEVVDKLPTSKIKFTKLGGLAVKLTNRTGGASVQGRLVKADTANNDSVVHTGANDQECMGVFLESGVANLSEAWVVIGGIVDVALDDNTGTTAGDWCATGTAGYADGTNAAPVPATHWDEIGHVLETVAAGGAGTHVLARILMHFN